jgi:hypothetical protein
MSNADQERLKRIETAVSLFPIQMRELIDKQYAALRRKARRKNRRK